MYCNFKFIRVYFNSTPDTHTGNIYLFYPFIHPSYQFCLYSNVSSLWCSIPACHIYFWAPKLQSVYFSRFSSVFGHYHCIYCTILTYIKNQQRTKPIWHYHLHFHTFMLIKCWPFWEFLSSPFESSFISSPQKWHSKV